jgi:ATP-binding cassette, subfamily B, multidrug efflux pump
MGKATSWLRQSQPARYRPLLRSLAYLRPYWRRSLTAAGLMLVNVTAALAVPQLVQVVLDRLNQGLGKTAEGVAAPARTESVLSTILACIVLFAVVQSSSAFAQTYLAQIVSQYVAYDLRNALFEKIQRLSFSYHDRNQTGQLMTRATSDVSIVQVFLGQSMLITLQAVLTLTGALLVLMLTDWHLAAIYLPLIPLMLLLFLVFGARIFPMYWSLQWRLSWLNTLLQESIAGISIVKAFARERDRITQFNQAARGVLQQEIELSRVYSLIYPAAYVIAYLCEVGIVYLGGRRIMAHELTLGEWQKFLLYLTSVFVPVGTLGFMVSQLNQASVGAQRIFEILDTANEVSDSPQARPLADCRGLVEFQNVVFRYFQSRRPVLQNVSFVARPGQTVALLGATGSGKTSVINLIPRFYDASEGRVLIDGHDTRDLTLANLRNQIGIVLQETTLFRGTIRENIAYGRPDASDAEIESAARAAAAHNFILSFPDGYSTRVGERGVTLSGGQRQRLAIARALLMNPRILILDDATSSVDVATEHEIQQALSGLMRGRTSFVIAQRISTVQRSDLILVLDQGTIVAQGSHQELLESSPEYADLYYSQLVDDLAQIEAEQT